LTESIALISPFIRLYSISAGELLEEGGIELDADREGGSKDSAVRFWDEWWLAQWNRGGWGGFGSQRLADGAWTELCHSDLKIPNKATQSKQSMLGYRSEKKQCIIELRFIPRGSATPAMTNLSITWGKPMAATHDYARSV
jgi:hypothetical protein